eukprot:m.16163 g.16163  ORF g.16163 m.16163 type:complete len:726 (-) comp3113_c0_seq1:2288-4465(-)
MPMADSGFDGGATILGSYELGSKLGEGAFASVRLARHMITEEKVAIKVFDKRLIKDEYVLKNLYREATILARLHHPNIIKLLETFETDQFYCIVTERAKMDLLTHLCSRGVYTEQLARRYVRQLISAIDHLHRQGIVHRDLKMENLMLDNDMNLKLIDFGLSNDMTGKQFLDTHCGSMAYSAPELLCKKPYGKEVDIWSIGVCLYVLLTGKLPFPSERLTEMHALMLDGAYSLPDEFSGPLRTLMMRFFQVKPHKRITLAELTVDEWIIGGEAPLTDILDSGTGPLQLADIQVSIVEQMVRMGIASEADITHSVLRNACNNVSCIYHLLILRERRIAKARRRSKDSSDDVPAMTRSTSNKSISGMSERAPEQRTRSISMSRRTSDLADDQPLRRPPSSMRMEPETPPRRQSMSSSTNGDRRNSMSSRPRDTGYNAEEGGGIRRRSSTRGGVEDSGRHSRSRTTSTSQAISVDSMSDLIETMRTHLLTRVGDWEFQLERATHRALLHAMTFDLLTLLRAHGWDGMHFRGLRQYDVLADGLARLQEATDPYDAPLGSPPFHSPQEKVDFTPVHDTPLRGTAAHSSSTTHSRTSVASGRARFEMAQFLDGDEMFGFELPDLEASTRTARPSSELGGGALPPINGSKKPPADRGSPALPDNPAKGTLRRSSSGLGLDRRALDARLMPPPANSHTLPAPKSRPGSAAHLAPMPRVAVTARPPSPARFRRA